MIEEELTHMDFYNIVNFYFRNFSLDSEILNALEYSVIGKSDIFSSETNFIQYESNKSQGYINFNHLKNYKNYSEEEIYNTWKYLTEIFNALEPKKYGFDKDSAIVCNPAGCRFMEYYLTYEPKIAEFVLSEKQT